MPHGAVVLSSQLAILAEGRAGTSLPVGQLPRGFLLDRMLDQWLHGRKSRKCFLRPFHSAFKAASRLQDDASVFRLVYSGCPRSCLMAHSDSGHPSVRSPGPVVLVCHKTKAGGVSPPCVPQDTPSLNTDKKKEVRRRKSDDMNSHASVGPPETRSPDGRVGSPTLYHRKPREKMPWIQLLRPETSSEGPNATRPQSVVPAVKTRLLFRAPPINGLNRRTGLPSRLPTRSIVGFTGYITNLHSSRGEAMSKGEPAESGKESRPDDFPSRPFQLPYLYQRVFFFFLRTHPLEVRWSWN